MVQEGVYEEMVKLLANQATNEIAVGAIYDVKTGTILPVDC